MILRKSGSGICSGRAIRAVDGLWSARRQFSHSHSGHFWGWRSLWLCLVPGISVENCFRCRKLQATWLSTLDAHNSAKGAATLTPMKITKSGALSHGVDKALNHRNPINPGTPLNS